MAQRLIAIGDIHGNAKALNTLICALEPHADDTLVFLGDYVDRGSQSREVIEILLALKKKCKCHFIRGNHEDYMLAALQDPEIFSPHWNRYGGEQTCASYGASNARALGYILPETHRKFLEDLCDFVEIDNTIFTHAGYDQTKPENGQDASTLRYDFLDASHPDRYQGKRVVCGHTSQKSGMPSKLGNTVCIDTSAARLVTAYDLTSDRFYQADSATNSGLRNFSAALP